MCGGEYKEFESPRQLLKVNGEVLVERTIRLLKENGIIDIAISTNNPMFDYLEVEKLRHTNTYVHESDTQDAKGWWLDAFYPVNEPVCYIFGDVYFSENAIKTIVKAETKDIELFASMPPFTINYCKNWVEPFALKVENTDHLHNAIEKTKQLALEGKTWRKNPIIWELWTVIKDMPLQTKAGQYVYNYTKINDYTVDVDDINDIKKIERYMKYEEGKMIRVEVIEDFTLGRFNELKNIQRKNLDTPGRLYKGDIFECTEDLVDYLSGNNRLKKTFLRVIEVLPKEEPKVNLTIEEPDIKVIAEEINKITKKTTKKKTSKK